ncbi:MAG: hypothetical protein B1H03_01220 [Planctomycetales bacterium 4484_113]|nr:MAG: hypothetical protein B1H03_01220 [Planctomycetales bacterium 4484_113]
MAPGLKEYLEKRDFEKTLEPSGEVTSDPSKPPRFNLQKHAASRLHYDFRMELGGVLVSWAIPKGPSLSTKDRRLALRTEDHPLEYLDFEGTIEEGSYGAGKVIVWDRGIYIPINAPLIEGECPTKEAVQAAVEEGRAEELSVPVGVIDGEEWLAGKVLEFALLGHRLNGRWKLIRFRGQERTENWLLQKGKDSFATGEDIVTQHLDSVISGRTVEQVE